MYLYVDEKIGWIIVQDTDTLSSKPHHSVYFVLTWTLPSWYKIALWDDYMYERKVFISNAFGLCEEWKVTWNYV